MKKLVWCLLLLLAVVSCVRHEDTTEDDQFQVIQRKIDNGQDQEAEEELSEILEDQPDHERARVILASIYVKRSGISLKDYFMLERIAQMKVAPSQKLIDLKNFEMVKAKPGSDLEKAVNFLRDVNDLGGLAKEILVKFDEIPVVSDEGAENLYQAVLHLETLEMKEDGNALYRAVIKLFYFKYLWMNGHFLTFGDNQFCSMKVEDLQERVRIFQLYTVGLIRDAKRGFPKDKVEFEKQAVNLENNSKDAQEFLKSIGEPKETVKSLLEETAKLQKVEGFKCEF